MTRYINYSNLIQPPLSSTQSEVAEDLRAILGDVQLGRDMSGNFGLSLLGLALRRPNNAYVRLDADEGALEDVTPLVLPGVDPLVVKIPTLCSTLRRGSLLVTSDIPFSPFFVLEVCDYSRIRALDPLSESVTFVEPIAWFADFVVEAVSLFDFLEEDVR
jgi:hypothetical protein